MELFYASLLTFSVFLISIFLHFFFSNKNKSSSLPPGNTGWPFVGETLEFLSTGWKGHPESFIFDRIANYSSHVFRTHLLGQSVVVLCGAKANKFIFSNENKLFQGWWPSFWIKILFDYSTQTSLLEESNKIGKMLPNFYKPEALQRYIGIMDHVAQTHFADGWENKHEILTCPIIEKFVFSTDCGVMLGMENPDHVYKFAKLFHHVASGIFSIPINLPGMQFNKAIKASKIIRKELVSTIKQRKIDLAQGKASPTQDMLSQIISSTTTSDDNEKFLAESNIASMILLLLVGGHDITSSICSSIVYYLAEFPEIYERVYIEQIEIAYMKKSGEVLNWEDVRKMKYSWNVACEALRLASPSQGAFREVITDFTYNGFSIPKGWNVYWSTNSTHKNPECFPEPKRFDPSRFEGSGPAPYTYTPFGGGPRMCPGREYAKLKILVFMHNLVKRFKFEKIIPNEKIVVNPLSIPSKGLPLRLYPHNSN